MCCVYVSRAMQLDMCEYGRKWEIFGSHWAGTNSTAKWASNIGLDGDPDNGLWNFPMEIVSMWKQFVSRSICPTQQSSYHPLSLGSQTQAVHTKEMILTLSQLWFSSDSNCFKRGTVYCVKFKAHPIKWYHPAWSSGKEMLKGRTNLYGARFGLEKNLFSDFFLFSCVFTAPLSWGFFHW